MISQEFEKKPINFGKTKIKAIILLTDYGRPM